MRLKIITTIALVSLTAAFLQADVLSYNKVLKNLKGISDYKSENYEKAEKSFSENALEHPDDARLHFNNGNAQYKKGDLDAAEQSYQMAMRDKDFEHKSELYQNMGNVKFQQKDYKNAIGLYRNALVEDPANPDARYNYELASKFLQQQQEQKQKQQSDENEENDDKDKEKQDQQDQQNQDKKEQQDKKDQEKSDQKDDQEQDQQNKDQKQEEQKPDDEKSKEEQQKQQKAEAKKDQEKKDADKLLKALLAKEKEEMKKDKEKMNVDKAKTGKYW